MSNAYAMHLCMFKKRMMFPKGIVALQEHFDRSLTHCKVNWEYKVKVPMRWRECHLYYSRIYSLFNASQLQSPNSQLSLTSSRFARYCLEYWFSKVRWQAESCLVCCSNRRPLKELTEGDIDGVSACCHVLPIIKWAGRISQEHFDLESPNFTQTFRRTCPIITPDMTSLAASGRLQNAIYYCIKVGPASRVE